MAAIITNKFRINNAKQFYESFSEAAPETYYLFVGRAHAWASDADVQGNTISEGTDASPPTPTDDISSFGVGGEASVPSVIVLPCASTSDAQACALPMNK